MAWRAASASAGVAAIFVTLAAAACSTSSDGHPPPDPAEVQVRVQESLEKLATFGNKRAGSDAARVTSNYLFDRFQKAGLAGVRIEPFTFPYYQAGSVTLTTTIDGEPSTPAAEAFNYSGGGGVDADIVWVGPGHPNSYDGKDVTGKIALVERDPQFHRGAQYELAVAHGAKAMLYVSRSPDNLIQVGTLNYQDEGKGPIPAIAIGSDDGQKLIDAATAGKSVRAVFDLQPSVGVGQGRNVIGERKGTDPSGAYLLIGAHYDTWFTGSLDNGTGVSELLAIADDFGRRTDRRLGLVFVAYDAEEVGLYGGYDYLRKHVTAAPSDAARMLAFVNFEIPANKRDGSQILVRTSGPFDDALVDTETNRVYQLYAGLDVLPAVLGGIVPTDIQGMYWAGLEGVTTACNSPYYHTKEDTPDKVDLGMLADSVVHFEAALDELDRSPVEAFSEHDPHVWDPTVTTAPQGDGSLEVDVVARDASGAPQPGALVAVWLDVDDFTRVFHAEVNADAGGAAKVVIPADRLARGLGGRWVHVTAGKTFPLSEKMVALP